MPTAFETKVINDALDLRDRIEKFDVSFHIAEKKLSPYLKSELLRVMEDLKDSLESP